MKNDGTYQAWLAEKRAASQDIDITDAVMETLGSEPEPSSTIDWKSPIFWVKAALVTLAFIAGPGRYAILFICLFISP